jgi:hypothetical protein
MADERDDKDDLKGDDDSPKPNGGQFKTGMAVGIGSAAIVAALLYARSGKKQVKK